jgi:hypothetical protein
MAFGNLIIGSDTYNGAGPGEYIHSSVPFGDPAVGFKLAPGKKANAKAPTSFTVSHFREKDILQPDGSTIRRRCTVGVQFNVPEGFSMEDVDGLVASLNTLVTAEFLTRLARGES